ncbi:MAG: hybrid sensor histidine kinase/response regulator [Verrucomicrobiota bacterium]
MTPPKTESNPLSSPFAGAKILVVDDQPINIRLLQRKLERHDLKVLVAKDGRECLEVVKETIPDLILLDVMMPEMDGIETCQHLKANPDTESIPVIFVTAKSSKEGKIEGLGVGAIDYITKPIDLDETIARVHTQLRFQQIYRENIELQERLAESRRSASVGAITQGIAHNLNNLLGVVVGYLDLMKTGMDNAALINRSVESIDKSINRVVDIVRQLSSLAHQEYVDLHKVQVTRLIVGAQRRLQDEQKNIWSEITLEVDPAIDDSLHLNTNSELFETVLLAVFNNAAESYGEAPGQDRKISLELEIVEIGERKRLLLKIFDQGKGIKESIRDTLFEPFVSSKTHVGCGMGLSVARHTIRTLGGDLTLESNESGPGTCACIQHDI